MIHSTNSHTANISWVALGNKFNPLNGLNTNKDEELIDKEQKRPKIP